MICGDRRGCFDVSSLLCPLSNFLLVDSPFIDSINDPPPLYSESDNRTVPSTFGEETPPLLPEGRWDLACSIGVQNGFLQLDHRSEPIWTPSVPTVTIDSSVYQRDGFSIKVGEFGIHVTNRLYHWTCDGNTDAGNLLLRKRDTISLTSLGPRLFLFQRTILKNGRDRGFCSDTKSCLEFNLQSPNFWTVTGPDIYQIDGFASDVVVQSSKLLRLWDANKQRFRWERKESALGRICGFVGKRFLREIEPGYYILHERETGRVYGNFRLPCHRVFHDQDEITRFGPVVSTGGLFVFKPCRRAFLIVRIHKRKVHARIWESAEDIKGHLVLRGGLENLELRLIGQRPNWNIYEATERVHTNGFLAKKMLHRR